MLYGQIVNIPMGTNCEPLVADLFLFCYEKDFMMSFSADKDAEIIEAFSWTSRYLDDVLNVDNTYFDDMVNKTYPSELQFNKANSSDTETPSLDLHLTFSDGFVTSKIYEKTRRFWFWYCKFSILRRGCSSCYILRGLYISAYSVC